jgi:murein DD-endopeptidase MepM/ murein hydrolase activator NlpD
MKRLIGIACTIIVGLGLWLVLVAASGPGRHSSIGGSGACEASPAALDAIAAALGGGYGPPQAEHAVTIWQTGATRDLPARAMIVALATAMQESTLRVLYNPNVPGSEDLPHDGKGTDHDSVGLFQQRQTWGPTEVLMDPEGSANLFYDKLERIDGWESMPVTVAAQAVQVSAHPDLYADDEPGATAAAALIAEIECEWVHPTPGAGVNSGWRTDERPTHNGVDLGAARGEEIHAASAGEVTKVTCNAHTVDNRQLSCDVDGSPEILGCGWYVEIAHAEGLLTRYCHMGQRPSVNVGDTVAASDVLGYVGSSGRSSGPHLHLEVHRSHSPSFDTAIEPQEFFHSKGIEL